MRDGLDAAASRIGEFEAGNESFEYAEGLLEQQTINTRLLLYSVINGHGLFFAQCLSVLARMPLDKVFSLLQSGARVALNALFEQCGMNAPQRNLMARLVLFARTVDLSDDVASRHFVVSALIEELIIEHEGDIPSCLEEAFHYLDEQNLVLARAAARGVMPEFSFRTEDGRCLPVRGTEPEG